jgi:polysaccharide biosynthesis protein PslH
VRVLLLAPQVPWPPQQGTAVRNLAIARQLAARHQVTLLTFGTPAEPAGPLTDAGVAMVAVPPPPARPLARRFADLFTTLTPDLARRLDSPAMTEAVAAAVHRAVAAGQPYDIVQVEGLEMARYGLAAQATLARSGHPARLIYDAHNAEWVLQHRAWQADLRRVRGWPGAGYSIFQTVKLRRFERHLLAAAAATVAVSRADRQALRRLAPGASLIEVPNGVDTQYYQAADPALADPSQCVFVGKMDFRPNIDAITWFCPAVWPLVRIGRPDARLAIVGRDPVPRVRAVAGDGIEVTGTVEDVRPWLARAAVVVVPLRVGGGTRLKILEAMAMGKAIVATPMAAEGLAVVDGRELTMAAEPRALAEAIVRLMVDAALRMALGSRARACVERDYRWDTLVPRIEALYDQGDRG